MDKIEDIKGITGEILADPQKYGYSVTMRQLANTLRKLSFYYYNTGEPLVPDPVFDLLRDILKERDPNNEFLTETGSPIPHTREKIILPFPMTSLDKIKPDTKELNKWKSKYTGPYIITDKLDGISGLLYKTGKKLKLYTRGDILSGLDISFLVPYIIPESVIISSIPENTAIRGEIIISKKNFDKIKTKFKNPRNTAAGLVNSKNYDINLARITNFIAYGILNPRYKPSDQFNKLKSWKIPALDYISKPDITEKYLSDLLSTRRQNSPYEIDGLVISDDKSYDLTNKNPEYSFAYKMVLKDQIAQAKIKNIEWNITMYGIIKPTIIIDPVELVGVTIKRATGFNAKFIVDNKLGPGAIIEIIRSGDVIPTVHAVIKPADKPDLPDIPYTWTKTGVDIIVKDTHGAASEAIIIRQLIHFFKTMDIANISDGVVTKLVENGYQTIKDILNISRTDFAQIPGFGEKLYRKIFWNILNSFANTNLETLMAASNIFGRGLGTRKLKLIVDKYPNILTENWDKKTLKTKILDIKGFSDITASQFASNFQNFKKFFADLETVDIIDISYLKYPKKIKKTGDLFLNQKIIFTGFRDDILEKYIVNNGGQLGNSVSKNTSLVIYKPGEKTSKLLAAEKLGIKTMTPEEFKKEYNIK